jgi:hypothetical protein
MTVIEIRIIEATDFMEIDTSEAKEAAPGGPDRRVIVVRAARPAAPAPPGAPRPAGFALDYAGWHARLAGSTQLA